MTDVAEIPSEWKYRRLRAAAVGYRTEYTVGSHTDRGRQREEEEEKGSGRETGDRDC